ncbi:MAG: tetratricopeptide repeat protein [Bacteroidetes bacterium]|nr:tetratricopeptide repeat protein [Bacteroidota bacterium]
MSEMLGNQYFLGRKYSLAMAELEDVVAQDPGNKVAMKKLIICYTQVGNIDAALKTFHNLISEDIEFIINTDVVSDDCPCPELVVKEDDHVETLTSLKEFLMFGILWLFCNPEKSKMYLEKALEINPNLSLVKSSISLINAYIEKHNTHAN